MERKLREGDYILITDYNDDRYLQIGKIVERHNQPNSDDVAFYNVEFSDGPSETYSYVLDEMCKVLMFKD